MLNAAASTHLAQNHARLLQEFSGDFCEDLTTRRLYATDASVYEELPAAVALPREAADIEVLIRLAAATGLGLIPRTAGTSLAGQVVGSGIVVDVSRYMHEILEINAKEKWVRVQPGVIRNELNMALRPAGLMFGPETSTANRAMIGGMLGNNSCGSNSIQYGTTRDHVLELRGFFSDGSESTLRAMSPEELRAHADLPGDTPRTREAQVYAQLHQLLANPAHRQSIENGFPDPAVTRRNTGYALDLLAQTQPFGAYPADFNLCQLVAGSEGTLFFATEIKLRCVPVPPAESAVICGHFETVDQALRANIIAMQFAPYASELIDHHVLAGAARNLTQQKNMAFVQGSPRAILIVELRDDSQAVLQSQANELVHRLQQAKLGYHFPILFNEQSRPVWELRKAGLGVAANVPGDFKPVTVIEDTAVSIQQLPDYIRELNEVLSRFGFECVHYGHAGSGELHLRPLINLKTATGQQQFRELAGEVARLVKKYRGSLSGEHGDGRLRGEFLEEMVGPENYELLRQVKQMFDPEHRFNPGKIIDAPSLLDSLRVAPAKENAEGDDRAGDEASARELQTIFDFSSTHGILGAAEMCSGSGDCRKSQLSGGTMCPSYMATRNEADSTRGRANILRQALNRRQSGQQLDQLADDEVKQVLDLCLSCKGCKNECPSNVDMAKLKAEFTHAYHQRHGVPFRSRLFANVDRANRLNALAPWFYNFLVSNSFTRHWVQKFSGVHANRRLPRLHPFSLRRWFNRRGPLSAGEAGHVFLFCDEFTNSNDVPVGMAAVELLESLGWSVRLPQHRESGRAAISKGLLDQARDVAIANVRLLSEVVDREHPLLGLEPSALLTLRDEYPQLVPAELRDAAQRLAEHSLLVEEWLAQKAEQGQVSPDKFTTSPATILLHGHCHQKALASLSDTEAALSLPANYEVQTIPSGCCGMAGSFGYEIEHYDISMQIGELVLFPAIRNAPPEYLLAAPGTSCRHQIHDGTERIALHPVQILRDALLDPVR